MITNPAVFDIPADCVYMKAWLGNNTLCYLRNNKIVFNHAIWYVYKSQVDDATPAAYIDSDSDCQDEGMPPSAAFLMFDY